MKIIYEDRDILVCFKPAGIATQTSSLGEQDMVSLIKNYLVKQGSGKDPYLGIVHRLDQPVSGLLVFGKNKKSSTVVLKEKEYYALCSGKLVQKEGELKHSLWKNPRTKKAEIIGDKENRNVPVSPGKKDGKDVKEARLTYRLVKEEEETSLVRVTLDTGRFHQIRAQFSAIGHPLLGDKKYGDERSMELSRKKQIRTIALCAWHLRFLHPVTKKEMEFYLQEEDLPAWGHGIQTENR